MEEQELELCPLDEDMVQALEEALNTVEVLSEIREEVEENGTEVLTDTEAKLIHTAVESFSKTVGIHQSVSLESFSSKSIAIESISARIKLIIDTLKKAFQTVISKFKEFVQKVKLYLDATEQDLERLRSEMSSKNLISLNPLPYKTTAVRNFARNRQMRTRFLDGQYLVQSLQLYQADKFEMEAYKRGIESLKVFKKAMDKVKSNSADEDTIDEIIRSTFKTLFKDSFVSQVNKVQGVHKQQHYTFFNEDEILTMYRIEDIYQNIAMPSVEIVYGQNPIEREVEIKMGNGTVLKNLFDELTYLNKKTLDMREFINDSTEFLNTFQKRFDSFGEEKNMNKLSVNILCAKDILKSVQAINSFVTLVINRNVSVIKSYSKVIRHSLG